MKRQSKNARIAIPLVILMLHLSPSPTRASISSELVETVFKSLLREGSRDAVEQLARTGGRAAVREVLEVASREGGETLARRCAILIEQEGVTALRALKTSPKLVVSAVEQLPAAARRGALNAIEREGPQLIPLITTHGPGALQAASAHPGVGTRLVAALGPQGIELVPSLTTDQAILLARHADDLARLPAAEKSTVMQLLHEKPAQTLDFLEAHPKTLAIGTAAVGVYAMRDNLFGASGKHVGSPTDPQGAIDRLFYWSIEAVKHPLQWITIATIALASLVVATKVYISSRAKVVRVSAQRDTHANSREEK